MARSDDDLRALSGYGVSGVVVVGATDDGRPAGRPACASMTTSWRTEWQDRLSRRPSELEFALPVGTMRPAGYVLQQHGVRLGQMVGAYQRWSERIPGTYRSEVLDDPGPVPPSDEDESCLARLEHYRSLIPMAQDARKPVFDLKPADGAFGGHQAAVRDARRDFRRLAGRIEDAIRPHQQHASGR